MMDKEPKKYELTEEELQEIKDEAVREWRMAKLEKDCEVLKERFGSREHAWDSSDITMVVLVAVMVLGPMIVCGVFAS